MSRALFEELGGFDERFDHYGGEDWELAHRAWTAGALIAHVPDAVAWHDGGDWATRQTSSDTARVDKNVELLALSRLLPDPALRGGGQWFPYVQAVVRMAGDDPAAVLLTARSAFASDADCGFWLTGPRAASTAALIGDPRISAGDPPSAVRARSTVEVQVTSPCDLSSLVELCRLGADTGILVTPSCTVVSTRASRRVTAETAEVPHELIAELFGRRDCANPVPASPVALERDLPQTRR